MDIQECLDLVTSQHRNKTKFVLWLTEYLEKLHSGELTTKQLVVDFDLDAAIGAQLDVIGEIVGISRYLTFEPQHGPKLLQDEKYRLILKAKISFNQWDGTIEGIYSVWDALYSDIAMLIRDNQNLTITAIIVGLNSDYDRELAENGFFVPKPMGISMEYSFTDQYMFGYGEFTGLIRGYGEGEWV